jgi:hypothetical protein
VDNEHAVLNGCGTMDDMANVKQQLHTRQQVTPPELQDPRLFNEINLLRLEGFYFCLDPKEAARRTKAKYEFFEIIKRRKTEIEKRPVVIVPHPHYGYPSILAYKVLQAIMRKLSWFSHPMPDTVQFSQRELARLVGRSSFGGSDQEDFYNAIQQLRSTRTAYWYYDKVTDEWSNRNMQILDTDIWSGREHQITRCSVQVHSSIVESLNNRHAMCLNYTRMEKLAPIGVALFKRLFFHFSNLYSLKRTKDFTYTKNYTSVCTTWLGGLKVLRYKSDILRDQLGRHLDALKHTTLIKDFAIEKNIKGDGFNLVFIPGEGFFEDYDRFYLKHLEIDQEYHKNEERKKQEQPLRLVEKFYQNLYHRGDLSGMVILDKEIELAKTLLETYTPEEITDLILYTIDAAGRTKFAIRSFGGVKVYLNAWLDEKATRTKRAAMQQKKAAEEKEQRLRDQYDRWWQQEVTRLRQATPPEEIAALEEAETAKLMEEHQNPLGFPVLVRVGTEARLAARYHVQSFEEWKAKGQSVGFDRSDCGV